MSWRHDEDVENGVAGFPDDEIDAGRFTPLSTPTELRHAPLTEEEIEGWRHAVADDLDRDQFLATSDALHAEIEQLKDVIREAARIFPPGSPILNEHDRAEISYDDWNAMRHVLGEIGR